MSYDRRVPAHLKKTQQWFASIITRAIDEESLMNPISPSGIPMEEEAEQIIAPSPTLRPAQRIQLYNQQYWWRLLNALHENFPLVTRLFGYHNFNLVIGFPFIEKHVPDHWALSRLGHNLAKWIQENYCESDKELVYNAACVDWAYNDSFLSAQGPSIDSGNLSEIFHLNLTLQPSVKLFQFPYELFQCRLEFIKQEVDYWIEHDFPELKKDKSCYYFTLYRNRHNDIAYQEITEPEYLLLSRFQTGTTIEKSCTWLERQKKAIREAAMQNLHLWFQEWTARKWLASSKQV